MTRLHQLITPTLHVLTELFVDCKIQRRRQR